MRIFHQGSLFFQWDRIYFFTRIILPFREKSERINGIIFISCTFSRTKEGILIILFYCYILLSSSIVLLSSYIGTWLLRGKLIGIALSRTQIIRDSIYFRPVAFRNCAKNCACIFSGRGKITKFIVRDHG